MSARVTTGQVLRSAGLSHKQAPLLVREKLAVVATRMGEMLPLVRAWYPGTEVVLLSTCNRTELYAWGPFPDEREEEFLGLLPRLCQAAGDFPVDLLALQRDDEVVRHLFQVTAGLASMVLGEAEIMGQVKDAYQAAVAAGTTGPVLNALFQRALSVAREIRTARPIGRGRVSVSSVAVSFAEKIFSHFKDKRALVLGAGETAELTLRHLLDREVQAVAICNRTYERAERLASTVGGKAVHFDRLYRALEEADIVISSTASPHPIVTADPVRKIMAVRRQAPLLFVDLAVPRDIAEEVGTIDNVFLYTLDDLNRVAEQNRKEREKELDPCLDLVRQHAETVWNDLRLQEVGGIFREWETVLDRLGREEIARFLRSRQGKAAPGEEELLQLVGRITGKLTHPPKIYLRRNVAAGEGIFTPRMFREMFGLIREEKTAPASPEGESVREQV